MKKIGKKVSYNPFWDVNNWMEVESTEIEKALERIAMEEDYLLKRRGGIDVRNNDSDDFPEISIRSLQVMLKRAYLLGRADANRKDKEES